MIRLRLFSLMSEAHVNPFSHETQEATHFQTREPFRPPSLASQSSFIHEISISFLPALTPLIL